MNVLILIAGQDIGGQGIAIKQAFDRYAAGGWNVRSANVSRTYLSYEEDLVYPRDADEILELYRTADIVHLRSSFKALRLVDQYRRPRDAKPMIIQHHGTGFRNNSERFLREARQRNVPTYVSTIDLTLKAPGGVVGWIPAPVEIDALSTLATAERIRKHLNETRTLIGHAPTVREVKHTDVFLAAVDGLRRESLEFDVDLIEKVSFRECLERKARCDVFYDQLAFGYGNNGLEAFAMGIPCVSGAEDPRVLQRMRRMIGDLPFVDATRETLGDALRGLLASSEQRDAYRELGRRYVEQWHHPRRVVERLQTIYAAALDQQVVA